MKMNANLHNDIIDVLDGFKSLIAIFVILFVIAWGISGFGLIWAILAWQDGLYEWTYAIIIFDIIVLCVNIYERYFYANE